MLALRTKIAIKIEGEQLRYCKHQHDSHDHVHASARAKGPSIELQEYVRSYYVHHIISSLAKKLDYVAE